ncbi:LPS-assembly protein LptD [Azonexus hydrophilus]|jgi:LPS-assembly protein|uniref:LPS-assembly protein LptD n=1 Tax=Azonexus hydrophilus TaxID=418702 RepID=A0ABZ2XJ02_9RHOO|nr:LPS-assembly protein LptD [Azonexus hydrophilus]MBS4018890.1 LPS-assembly protein LptD [Dechloromonas sp.]
MTGFSRRPIAVLVCCLFAGTQGVHAAVGDPASLATEGRGAVQDEVVVPLRLERRLVGSERKRSAPKLASVGSILPLTGAEELPLFLVADRMEGAADQRLVAEGNVELRKSGMTLQTDRLTYQHADDEIEAIGAVRLTRGAAEIEADYLKMKLSEQLGFADKARYSVSKEVSSRFYQDTSQAVVTVTGAGNSGAPMMLNVPRVYGLPTDAPSPREISASGVAERIDFLGENHMRLNQGTFSTCKPSSPDWYLKAGVLDLDYDSDFGRADDASLWFKGVPLFYAPKAWFPISSERRSGLLSPSLKQSTKTGFDVALPIYWNIAPNYDATFYPRYMSKRGTQLGIETRYLDESFAGDIRAEYIGNDTSARRQRYAYTVRHQHQLSEAVSAALNWNGVSDDTYWEDMSSRLLQTSQVQLERRLALNYVPSPWLQTSLQLLRYQTLQPDASNPVERPYFLEPQLNLVAYRPNLAGMDFTMLGQYSRFTHDDVANKDRGDRLVLYPQISLPIVSSAFQLTPKLGLHMSSYAIDRATLNGGGQERISRTLPIFSLDSTVVFERQGTAFGRTYLQTLEPRIYYVRIPYKDQSRIPEFDTALSDFNFAQVFSENRYSGQDRINDADQLTVALTSRVIDEATGAERFKAMVGQRYYFSGQRVALKNETSRPEKFSNLIASVSGLVAPKTYAEGTWEYNHDQHASDRFSAGVRFQPDYGKVLSASYRYTRDPLTNKSVVDQIDLAGQWPLAAQWYGIGRFNYSLRDKQALETIGGLEYNAGCWAVRGVVQRLAATSGSPNTSFFLQLELQDFTSIGSNPLGLLRRSIPGYGKTNELPNDRSLISNQ